MRRRLPSLSEAAAILARTRTRPAPRPPAPAARILNPVMRALDARFGKRSDDLKAHWTEIVGEALARRTEPVRLIAGRGGAPGALEVRVQGASAALIQHQAPALIERVNLVLGRQAVGRLTFVQGIVARRAPGADEPAAARFALKGRRPLDAAAEAALEKGLEGLKDDSLRSALLRLGRGVLARGGNR